MPDGQDKAAESETLFWQTFLEEIDFVVQNAMAAGLPLRLASGGLLMAASKYYVLEAKVRGCPVPKIGAAWKRWCDQEEARLAEMFAKKVT